MLTLKLTLNWFYSGSIAQRSSSRVNYVNFISESPFLSPFSVICLVCPAVSFSLPPSFLSLVLSFNDRPLDDFVAPQIANIVRTSANPNQRRQSRRCSVNVASRVSPSLSMHLSKTMACPHYSCLERALLLHILFHQELLNSARGDHGSNYNRLC